MSILGIDLDASSLRWFEVHGNGAAQIPGASGRIKLSATRNSFAIKEFAQHFRNILTDIGPEMIAVREKPQIGRLKAGAASFYMEAALLLASDRPVIFVTNNEISKLSIDTPAIKDVDVLAYKSAVVGLRKNA